MFSSELKVRLGCAVRDRRHGLGLSQEELGERAGLHRTYVADVERGVRNPSLESIGKLAKALQVSIVALLSRADATGVVDVTGGGPQTEAHPMEILLVEDDPDDVALTVAAFKQVKLRNRLLVMPDGRAALDYLFKAGAEWAGEARAQLILLDLGLPGMSGLEVLRRLKGDRRTRSIPVIILTGSRADVDVANCRRLGATHYIPKPVDFERFSQVTMRLDLQWALLRPASGQPERKSRTRLRRLTARHG